MDYYAHSMEGKERPHWQSLKKHLEQTALIARLNASKFGAEELGAWVGMLHDLGKYSLRFQERLNGAIGKVDHSTAGAQEAVVLFGKSLGRIMAYVIAGHHTGLPDGGPQADETSLNYRLNKALCDYSDWRKEIQLPEFTKVRLPIEPVDSTCVGFSVAFFARMLYSCLVDADFLDTESYLKSEVAVRRGQWPSLAKMSTRLGKYMARKQADAADTPINRRRQEILKRCQQEASGPTGLFTLTVPTGGGKTLSSLSFALHHALTHGLDRIIYAIPYTSIIEQNAEVFRSAVGNEAVLEHHCNFHFDAKESEDGVDASDKIRLSSQNWDAPLVVTTNVQLFESLFANRSSKCRKLHNLARSVIILDEAQMLPTDLLKPCLLAIVELVVNYGATIVLCTATQPALRNLLPKGLTPIEIVQSPEELYDAFRRVEVANKGAMSDTQLSAELLDYQQVLCIVNTRRHARMIYELMCSEEATYHLSARMCPVHRREKLKVIRDMLVQGRPCRVVSTQLVEAGVNVDFPVVYRSASGLDAIAQAAGRCNREGNLEQGQTYVFYPEKHGLPGGWFSRTADIAAMVMQDFVDPLELDAIRRYFDLLYGIDEKDLDKKDVLRMFRDGQRSLVFPFREVADQFRLIDTPMVPIIIPWDNTARNLLRQARFSRYPSVLERRFQPYAVQVYRQELAELERTRAVDIISDRFHVLSDMAFYDEELGLTLASELAGGAGEPLIF